MQTPSLNLIVLRAADPSSLASFYEGFGLSFEAEKHGTGPEHQACVVNGSVFEIYPRAAHEPETSGVRLGFNVPSIDAALDALGDRAELLSNPKQTRWGRRCVLKDPEGHKVELLETS